MEGDEVELHTSSFLGAPRGHKTCDLVDWLRPFFRWCLTGGDSWPWPTRRVCVVAANKSPTEMGTVLARYVRHTERASPLVFLRFSFLRERFPVAWVYKCFALALFFRLFPVLDCSWGCSFSKPIAAYCCGAAGQLLVLAEFSFS